MAAWTPPDFNERRKQSEAAKFGKKDITPKEDVFRSVWQGTGSMQEYIKLFGGITYSQATHEHFESEALLSKPPVDPIQDFTERWLEENA